MKVRFVDHVNHIRYKDVEVKDMKQAEEMFEDGSIYDDDDGWEYGKEYGESYFEEIKVEDNDEPKTRLEQMSKLTHDPIVD